MIAQRDEFPKPVKELLAKRVAYLCSAPFCRKGTIGPSETRASGTSVSGIAAHITGAAESGPRRNDDLSSEERKAYSNGIWLCDTHGRLVDNDTVRFEEDLLRQWKAWAESNASRRQELPDTESGHRLELFRSSRRLTATDLDLLQQQIHEFLLDVGVNEAWGDLPATHVRRLLYELARNDIEHGGATRCHISANSSWVSLTDNGLEFSLQSLLSCDPGRGGRYAAAHFAEEFAGTLEFVHRRSGHLNRWSVFDVLSDVENQPCGLRLGAPVNEEVLERIEGCETVHLYTDGLLAYSDVWRILDSQLGALTNKSVVLHLGDTANRDDALAQFVHEHYPDVVIR
jgi:hypothetical protein